LGEHKDNNITKRCTAHQQRVSTNFYSGLQNLSIT